MQLIFLTDADRFAPAGLPWSTTDQARWAARTAAQNGTASAFVRIGKRIAIDPDRYHELVRAQQAA